MRPRNRRIGDQVRTQLADLLKGWGLTVQDHDDARNWPGDLSVANGTGVTLFVEAKGIRDEIQWPPIRSRPDYVRPRQTFPGRPHITLAGHLRLLEYDGIYAFCVYHMDEEDPRIRKVLYCDARDMVPPQDRHNWAMPWRLWQRCPPLTKWDIVRRLLP